MRSLNVKELSIVWCVQKITCNFPSMMAFFVSWLQMMHKHQSSRPTVLITSMTESYDIVHQQPSHGSARYCCLSRSQTHVNIVPNANYDMHWKSGVRQCDSVVHGFVCTAVTLKEAAQCANLRPGCSAFVFNNRVILVRDKDVEKARSIGITFTVHARYIELFIKHVGL